MARMKLLPVAQANLPALCTGMSASSPCTRSHAGITRASLTAEKSKDGKHSPVAVGETLRRLLASVAKEITQRSKEAPSTTSPTERENGLFQPRHDSDVLTHRASLERPADVFIPHGTRSKPEACDFAVTSCLQPAARNRRRVSPKISPTVRSQAQPQTPVARTSWWVA